MKMDKLEDIKEDFLIGEMFGKQWCSIPKSNFEWLIEQAEKVERYEKVLKEIREITFDTYLPIDYTQKIVKLVEKALKD